MAKKCKPCECPEGVPLWLGTFGDLMSLLLTFFILLLSMAVFVTERVDKAIGSVQGALGVLELGRNSEITPPKDIIALPIEQNVDSPTALNTFASMITEFSEMTKLSEGPAVRMEESEDGFIIRIANDVLFEQGKAEITSTNGKLFLERLAIEIKKLGLTYQVKVVGNSDNDPEDRGTYRDNWEISVARGVHVAQIFVGHGVSEQILSAGGNGEFDPIASNQTYEGRMMNRRTDLYFFAVNENRDEFKSKVGQTMGAESIQDVQ
ncbi:motility protein MotB [Helicobacter monodelphidis]|uniref:OmpA/MotB family protein n=1 Tax=Helicobacter sp. 15-1451 TaxID=2004995 RepID=UPI000DCD05B1|nr:flagellar motor protein MotB [Helicobacter sp. 15-1451]RAX59262.1 motility protein MotB [Helicobacter sp. 15-1451]